MDLHHALFAIGWWWNRLGYFMTDTEIIVRAIRAYRQH